MRAFLSVVLFVSAHAFAPTGSKASTPTALHSQRPYGSTGGIDGSTLVSGRRVDIDAPWGGSRPYPKDLDWNRSRASSNEKNFPWGSTGGNDGSTLVAKGRVDLDAPWGSNHPQRPSPKYYHQSIHQAIPSSGTQPGTTGGIAGSTLVAAGRIHPDSAYGKNFHRLHNAGTVNHQLTEATTMALPASQRTRVPSSVRRVAPEQRQYADARRN